MFKSELTASPSIFEPRWIEHRQKDALDALKQGAIEDIRMSQKLPVDDLVLFGLKEGFLQKGLRLFPDPRKRVEVPIDVILLSQILQRLNDEHSLLLAPYMLNSAELITRLGYNASHLTVQRFKSRIEPYSRTGAETFLSRETQVCGSPLAEKLDF